MVAWSSDLFSRMAENPKCFRLVRDIGRNSDTDVGDFNFGIITKRLESHSFDTVLYRSIYLNIWSKTITIYANLK